MNTVENRNNEIDDYGEFINAGSKSDLLTKLR